MMYRVVRVHHLLFSTVSLGFIYIFSCSSFLLICNILTYPILLLTTLLLLEAKCFFSIHFKRFSIFIPAFAPTSATWYFLSLIEGFYTTRNRTSFLLSLPLALDSAFLSLLSFLPFVYPLSSL